MRIQLALPAIAATALIVIPAAAQAQKLPKAKAEPLTAPAVSQYDPAALPQIDGGVDQAATDPALATEMDRIEAAVRLPANAKPLAAYSRFYAWADKGHTKVTGILLGWGTPGRKWIEFDDLPMVLAGGCGVISLVFDQPSGTIDEIYCNGAG